MLELDARYEWRGTPPNTHCSLFLISYFCVYTVHVLRSVTGELQVICGHSAYRLTPILLKIFFVWFRVAAEIQLESYSRRHTSDILCYDIMCVYCKSVYTSPFGRQLRLTTKLTYFMTAYYTQNDGFTANDASFRTTKLAKR